MPRNKDKDEKAEKGQQKSKDDLNLDLALKESFNSLKKDVSKLEFKPSLESILKKIDGHSVEKPKILFFHDKIKKQYFKYAAPIAALALFAIGYSILKSVNQKSSDMVAKVDSSDEFNEPGLNFSKPPNPEIKPKARSRGHDRKDGRKGKGVIADKADDKADDKAIVSSKKGSATSKTQSLSKAVEKPKSTETRPADAADFESENFESENKVEIASLDEGMSVKMRDSGPTAITTKKRGSIDKGTKADDKSAKADRDKIASEKKKLWAKISKGDLSAKTIIRLKVLLKKSNDKAGLKKLRVLLAKEKVAKPKK